MPAPQLMWHYQSTMLEEIVVVNITDGFLQYNIDNSTSVLVINNLTRNNAGIYYCNATNDIGFDLLTIQAIVARMCYIMCVIIKYAIIRWKKICVYSVCIIIILLT